MVKYLARIQHVNARQFVGMSKEMSLVNDETFALFSAFMPKRNEIKTASSIDVFDLIIYPKGYFTSFSPTSIFTKWACKEIDKNTEIPDGMSLLNVEAGAYAIFTHDLGHQSQEIYRYIYTEWVPNSLYNLDDRPHFDVLNAEMQAKIEGAKQEIWIPIKEKD